MIGWNSMELIERQVRCTAPFMKNIHPIFNMYFNFALQRRNLGGVKSTPSSPRLRVGVILTDPEPAKEAL